MRFSTASVVRLERSFRHCLKFLLPAKIVRLNAPLGYVKKALQLRTDAVLLDRLTSLTAAFRLQFLTHLTLSCFIKVPVLDHWKSSVLVSAGFPVKPLVSD